MNDSFPVMQFLIDGYTSQFSLDKNGKGGGILVYFQEDIPSKNIPVHFSYKKVFLLEINLTKKK